MCLTHFRVHVASAIIVRSPYLVSTDNGSAYIHVNADETRPQLETITEIMSTSLPRCQTSSHLHINTIVFNVNICIDGGKHQFGETTKIPDFKSLSWFLTQ